MASIRYLALHPCTHCKILRSQIGDLGLVADMERRQDVREFPAKAVKSARKRIFDQGGSVNYRGLDDKLTDSGSWAPTEVGPFPLRPRLQLTRGYLEWLLCVTGYSAIQVVHC